MFLHAIWCLYLSIIGTISLYETIDKMGFMRMSFKMNGQIVQATPMLAVQVIFMLICLIFLVSFHDIDNIFLFNNYVFDYGSHSIDICQLSLLFDFSRTDNKLESKIK